MCPGVRPRTVEQCADLIVQYLLGVPGHRVYRKSVDDFSNVWLPYYVNRVFYVSEQRIRDNYRPAHVSINLLYTYLGESKAMT